MNIGVFYRPFRNIEFQKRVSSEALHDDAKAEAAQHVAGLNQAGYQATLVEWIPDPLIMVALLKEKKIDLVFNASSYDELCFLEAFHIPYVGTGLKIVALDKGQRKILAAHAGVTTSRFVVADHPSQIPNHDLSYPLFVKPLSGRGSAGIDGTNIIRKPEDLPAVVSKITEKIGQPALIEEFIQGRELTVGVLGSQDPAILPILEIRYSFGETNTFEHKMMDKEILTCPADLSEQTKARLLQQVLMACRSLEIKDFGRLDFILDQNDIPYFLEVNTFAGLTFPNHEDGAHLGYMGVMATTDGLSQAQFLNIIIQSALQRYPLLKANPT